MLTFTIVLCIVAAILPPLFIVELQSKPIETGSGEVILQFVIVIVTCFIVELVKAGPAAYIKQIYATTNTMQTKINMGSVEIGANMDEWSR